MSAREDKRWEGGGEGTSGIENSVSKGTKAKNSSCVHPEAAGKVECEAEMAEQGSDHGGPCLSREENEHGSIDLWFSNPSPQFPPYPPPSSKQFLGFQTKIISFEHRVPFQENLENPALTDEESVELQAK